jgi:hypothetical protein
MIDKFLLFYAKADVGIAGAPLYSEGRTSLSKSGFIRSSGRTKPPPKKMKRRIRREVGTSHRAHAGKLVQQFDAGRGG